QGGTTFTLPNMYDTGRFPRSRAASLAVGTAQANALKSHTHTASSASAGDHTHTATVTDLGHTHTIPAGTVNETISLGSTPMTLPGSGYVTGSATTGISVSNSTNGAHTHPITVAATGDAETRPEALAFIFAVKT